MTQNLWLLSNILRMLLNTIVHNLNITLTYSYKKNLQRLAIAVFLVH